MTTTQVDYSRKWFVMAAIGMATSLETIDTSIVNLALPTLVKALYVDFALVQWVILAFVLTQATLMLAVGRLGDMLGKKPIFVAGFVISGLGALLCGLAPNIGWLIAFRVVQAVGVAMALALIMGIATEAFPPNERGLALGAIGGVVSLGIILGPLLGGVILEALSWRWIFFIELPFAAIGVPVALRYLPDVRPSGRQPFDYVGAALFFVSFLAFLLATTFGQRNGYGEPAILGLFGVAGVVFGLFIWWETRLSHPVMDLNLFRFRPFTVNLFLRLLSFVVYVGISILLPFYLVDMRGFSSTQAAYFLTAMSAAFGLTAPFAGTLADRFGAQRVVVIGLGVFVVGCLAISRLSLETSYWGLVWRTVLVGAGMGVFQSPNNSIIMGVAPRDRLGTASSLISVTRTVGRSTGIALLGAIWARQAAVHSGGLAVSATDAPIAAQVTALQETFLVAALILAVGLLFTLWDSRRTEAVASV